MFPSIGFPEGTKQIRPTSTEHGTLRITSPAGTTNFATYGCYANYRLNIHVENTNEMILLGFHRGSANNRTFQLKDPAGVTVLTGLCPNVVNDSGYISTYAQALVGPFFTSGGYHPLKYQVPAGNPTGDYYIQFSGSIDFDYFDLQVVTGAHTIPIPADTLNGRVYSKAWQFFADLNTTPIEPFSGKLYVYSDDSIVTSCKYKNVHIGQFSMFCNPYGCLNTGNFSSDCQSKNTNTSTAFPGIAQYKLFLNDPDPLVYPSGHYGALVGQPVYPYIDADPAYPLCSGRKIIYINVNKAGNVDIKITLPYGSPGTDVHLNGIVVVPGINEILWDGMDGNGNMVPDGTLVSVHITYVNGLTNLPLWDIEANPQGFEITLIRPPNPSGENPNSFWDDTQLTASGGGGGGSSCLTPPLGSNFTGCAPGSIAGIPGCHPWETNTSECHDKMINTWWFSASSSQASISTTQIVTPPPPTIIGNFDRCGPGVVNLVALVLTGEVVRWYTQASGGTPLGTSNSGVPFAQPLATTGTYTFYAEAYNPIAPYFCTSNTRTPIIVHAIDIPDAPVPQNAPFFHCGSGFVTMTVTPFSNTDVEWYDAAVGGTLLWVGNSFTTPFLFNSATYYAQAVNVTYTTHCTSVSRTPIIAEIRAVPFISNASNEGICSGSSPTLILQSTPAGAVFSWTATNPDGQVTGYTTPVNNGNLTNEVLTLSPGIYVPGTVNYWITPALNSCPGNTVNVNIYVNAYPDLTISPLATTTMCSGEYTNIPLSSQVFGATYSWSASGYSANITPFPSVAGFANPIGQQFFNSGHTVEPVTFSITPSAAGCTSPASDYTINVNPGPSTVLPVPAEQTVCPNVASVPIELNTDAIGTTVTYSWTAVCDPGIPGCPSGGSGTHPFSIPSATVDNTTFIEQNVMYTVTAAIGTCIGAPSIYIVKVNPTPDVAIPLNPPSPQIICSGDITQAVPLVSHVTTLPVDYSWTVNCDPGIPVCPGSVVSGNTLPQVAISNTDQVPAYATYNITPSVLGCAGPPSTYQVQVNPSPTVITLPMEQQICSGDQSALVQLDANVAGTTYTWVATPSSPLITGYQVAPGTGNIPPQTIFNSGTIRGFVNYHIIPSSQSGMPCPGAPADYLIYVNPLPNPIISGSPKVCYDQSGTVYTSPPHANHDYIWTVTGALSFSGNHTNSITVDWGPGPAGTIQLTEKDQNYTTDCSTTTLVYPVTIHPGPTPLISGPSTPCGNSTVNYSIGSPLPNHTYSWTISGGTPATGNNSGIDVTWANSNPVSVNVIEYITYEPGVTCSASAPLFPVSLKLIPDPAGTISGPGAVCKTLTKTYAVSSINNADSYTWWYQVPAGVTITNNGTSADVTFDATSSSGNLFVQGNKSGCPPGPQSPAFFVTVNPLPLVALSACFDQVTTLNAKPFRITGGTPLGSGGKYYIDGSLIAGNVLDPSTLTPVNHNISFTYTDINGCQASDTKILRVDPSNAGYICVNNNFTDPRNPDPTTNKYPTTTFTAHGSTTCWMLKNLSWGTTSSVNQPQTDNCIPERYCATNDITCTNNGGFYQWDELMQYGSTPGWTKGVCPPAWHVPTQTEWQNLIDAVSNMPFGDGIAGSYLVYPTGFHALMEGLLYLNNSWAFTTGQPKATMFWTSTVSGSNPVAHGVNTINPSISRYESSKANAFPVRCVKD
ncbi:MAG: PKD-like domain-containing protein [Bacteroidales bacterium]